MHVESPLRNRLGPDDRLIETLGYRPGEGIVRLRRHIDRMRRSAIAFGIAFDCKRAEAELGGMASGETPLRLRLTLDMKGMFEAASSPFTPTPPDAVWRIAIAGTRLDSSDPLIGHKTTRRAAYNTARAEFGTEIDEVVLLNERNEVCEGTITNVFRDDGSGMLETPDLTCGLLPGVLRGELVETGRALEATMTAGDLRAAAALFMGNSLRGLIRAELV